MPEREYAQTKFTRPTGATEILLVRHGESRAATASSPFALVNGHGDPELHPNGREQALKVGERLKHQRIDAVYVTNLRRTQETAAPICAHLGLEPIVEPDLREVFLGEWEGGVLRMKAADNDPVYQTLLREERWDVIPGGESHAELNGRITRALKKMHLRHPDQLVISVVHGGVIGAILAHAVQARPFAFLGADNGSISHIVMVGERIIVRRFNDATHLTDVLSSTAAQMT